MPVDEPMLRHARRILVIGCPGGGKSVLARALSTSLDLPYISVDRDFYWLPGWRKRDRSDIDRLIAKAVAEERWIMDGTGLSSFHLRLPRADAVIWLRLSRYACLYGAVSRTFRYFGRNRPELPAGCPERLSLDALAYIWNFERDAAPLIEAALQDHGFANSTVIIRSRKAASRFAGVWEHPGEAHV
ncbi:DNA topology modulation protein FlaR [Rhizobium laguerreae]|uniref:DNA topology modulation protein FlaR n=1 Tax=Rhizobium laguerreae TaxID=1076926 RepID=A0AB35FAK1_9HYPH|nr:DNA topology modulation protein FlaR [Rhizobium laguerreae]MBY3063257.1 DNA topology modulation protein FlaR [Rhizobium laguerreae]MBY3075945.1 DNA topology modulation protein FlaR [Rhizobium laguerreae]MBY3112185.1 DNA topology modulation protein FlaR [Rhizobium laguerreae]MBY3201101.1 DNA topology modulation protein FlaR [Rhizobium laguerreae]MBY3244453.1 DNA topology modulation protein FlaR [Rhizobium laguerreae]